MLAASMRHSSSRARSRQSARAQRASSKKLNRLQPKDRTGSRDELPYTWRHSLLNELRVFGLSALFLCGCSSEGVPTASARAAAAPTAVAPTIVALEGIQPLHRVGSILLGGQPSVDALRALQETGLTAVVDLRRATEARGFDERALTSELDLTYEEHGFGGSDPLTDEIFSDVRRLLAEHRGSGSGDLLLHCASSNRVGAVWLASRVMDEGVVWEIALAEAHTVGLRSQALEDAARNYVRGAGSQVFGELKEEIAAKLTDVPVIDVNELAGRIGSADAPILIDARAADEFNVSHIENAQHAETIEAALALLEGEARTREIVVYCSVGYRSGFLARELQSAGFSNARNLEGSIFEWANRGHPLYRGADRVKRVHPFDREWGQYLERSLWSELEGD